MMITRSRRRLDGTRKQGNIKHMKTRTYSNVLGAIRRQKKEGEAEEDMAKYFQKKSWNRWVLASMEPAGSASDHERWRLLVA